MTVQRIIDSHVHFIAPDRHVYPWMEQAPSLRSPHLPAHYRAAIGDAPVTGMVFVEVTAAIDHCVEEAAWVASLAAEEPRIQAIVARAPLADPTRRQAVLEDLRAIPLVRGIRDIIQWEGPGYCCQQSYVDGVRLAAGMGFHLELCIFHPQMDDVLRLVRACPDVRFVLNHCGKPGIRDRLVEPWRSRIRELARCDNVVCKVSALLTEADHARWRPEDILPYIDIVADCFGPERLLFGGDWPVCTLAGTWRDWSALVERATASWSPSDRIRFYHDNAQDLYGIAPCPAAP